MILTVLWWQLFFMKVDIEGSELTALPQWIESGALDKVGRITITLLKFLFNIELVDFHIAEFYLCLWTQVEQLAMELHLPPIHQQKRHNPFIFYQV